MKKKMETISLSYDLFFGGQQPHNSIGYKEKPTFTFFCPNLNLFYLRV